MTLKMRHARRPSRALVAGICLMFLAVGITADGPSSTIAGVTQTGDTDSGSGERWGRSGGRSLTFTVGNTSAFSALFWGATQAPSAAFDNSVNNPGEVMTTLDASNLALGIARWTGSAALPLSGGGSVTVPTRFTLTVTSGGNGVPLSINAGGALAGINVKSVGTFVANLLFEAQAVPGTVNFALGQWVPMLDFYDVQPTPFGNPPGTTGPVLTSFSGGFYFTNAAAGMTVEQHDLNEIARLAALQSTANQIKDGTEFLRIEVPGRLAPLAADVFQIKNNVQQLLQSPPPSVVIPQDLARRSDVENAKNSTNDILMILLGMKPCPLSPEQCATLTFMPQVARQTSADQIKQVVDALAVQATAQQVNELATQAGLGQVSSAINALPAATLTQFEQALNLLATSQSVEQLKQRLIDLAVIVDGITATLAAPTKSLDVQVVELTDKDSPKRRRWLVRTSIGGAPATSQLTGLVAISANKKQPSSATQVLSNTATAQLSPGLLEVILDVPESDVKDMAFQFSVRHASPGGPLDAGILIGSSK